MGAYDNSGSMFADGLRDSSGNPFACGDVDDEGILCIKAGKVVTLPKPVRVKAAAADQTIAAGDGITLITGLSATIVPAVACMLECEAQIPLYKITGTGYPAVYARIDAGGWELVTSIGMTTTAPGLFVNMKVMWSFTATAGSHTVDWAAAAGTDSLKIGNSTMAQGVARIIAVP